MSDYNVVSQYAKSDKNFSPYYMVTRQDDVIPFGAYVRNIDMSENYYGIMPFKTIDPTDTNPPWCTQQENGSIKINRDGYYFYNLFLYAVDPDSTHKVAVSVQFDRGENHYNLCENTNGHVTTVITSSIGGLYYFKKDDIVYGNIVTTPYFTLVPHSATQLQIIPYQFDNLFWG